jgi:SHAQKYF class myb-like DNA-binding protein
MLSDYSAKNIINLGKIIEPKKSKKNSSLKTLSTQISLDSKKSSNKSIKLNKPKKKPKNEVSNNSPNDSILDNYEIQLNISSEGPEKKEVTFQSGKWTDEEHEKFIEGILNYGNEWKKVQQIIKTRSSTQARSHAQKFFLRIKKLMKNSEDRNNIYSEDKGLAKIISQVLPKKYAKNLTENQREKLLSAISNNIKLEENFDPGYDPDSEPDGSDCFDYTNNFNDNSVIIKNNKISFDLSFLNANEDIFMQSNKISIGKKRKKSKNKSNKDKIDKLLNIKKEESRRPSFDLTFCKLNEKENFDDMNYLNNFGVGENDFIYKNNDNIRKNSLSSNRPSGINENKKKNIINNVINLTNNIINNKFVYNLFNQEINNNCLLDFYNMDKNDSINNEKNQGFFGNFQNQEKYSFNDKPLFNGNQFNKMFNSNFNMNKDNEFNENENINNEVDPFQLNFSNFSNENFINNNENERQMSIHENDFIKLTSNI